MSRQRSDPRDAKMRDWRRHLEGKPRCPSCGAGSGHDRVESLQVVDADSRQTRRGRVGSLSSNCSRRSSGLSRRSTARTAATAASQAKRRSPVERVAELTANGSSAAEIAVKLGLWSHAGESTPGKGGGTRRTTPDERARSRNLGPQRGHDGRTGYRATCHVAQHPVMAITTRRPGADERY